MRPSRTSPYHSTAQATSEQQGLWLMVAGGALLGTIGVFVQEAGQHPLMTVWSRCAFGALSLFLWSAAAGKLHHRQVAGHLEGEFVTGLAVCLGCRARGLLHIRRHPFEVFW